MKLPKSSRPAADACTEKTTRCCCFMQAMAMEINLLRSNSEQVTEQDFALPERRGTPTVGLAAHLLRGFL
jgi:hypothetical protein